MASSCALLGAAGSLVLPVALRVRLTVTLLAVSRSVTVRLSLAFRPASVSAKVAVLPSSAPKEITGASLVPVTVSVIVWSSLADEPEGASSVTRMV